MAARLGSEESLYGSSDFVLTRHTWPPFAGDGEATPFWMLYMHLAGKEQRPQSVEAAARSADVAPWLRSEPILEVTVDTLNTRDAPAGPVDGSVERNAQLVARSEPQPKDGYLWRKVDVPGGPYAQYVATQTEDGSTRYVRTREPTVDEEALKALMSGDVVALDEPVAAGDMLWWSGAFGLPSGEIAITDAYERGPTVHWEVFAADKAFGHEDGAGDGSEAGAWSVFEDKNDDHRLDPREVEAAGQLQDRWAESTAAETDTFAKAPSEERSPFFIMEAPWSRRIAARFRSEWGVKDVETVMADEKGYEADGRAAMKRLQWWDEVRDARSNADYSVELPEDATVWHYHPVGALEALRPRFTAEGNSTRLNGSVETIEDVAEKVIAGFGYSGDLSSLSESEFERVRSEMHGMPIRVAAPATDDPEPFAHIHFDPSQYGHFTNNGRTYYLGVYSTGSGQDNPDFFELLNDPEIKGRPEKPFDRNVWTALSESEGSLKAINTYDAAFLSVGPFQHTAGTGEAKGELPGVLDTLRENAPDTYWHHFGRFGLQPVGAEVSGGAKYAYFELHGKRLDSAEQKQKLRRFKWAHRFKESMGDPAVHEWVLKEGFKRLDRVRGREISLEVETDGQKEPAVIDTRIGQIFRRDLSQALLLDWHINSPIDVWSHRVPDETGGSEDRANNWIKPVQRQFEEWGITSKVELSQLTREQELQLVTLLLQARVGNMTAPGLRAGKILAFASNNLVKEVAGTEDYSMAQGYESVGALIKDFLSTEVNEKAADAWDSIDPPATLEFQTGSLK